MSDHSRLWSRVRWSLVVVVFALFGVLIAVTANRLSDTADSINGQRARADRLEAQVADLKAAAEEQGEVLAAANDRLVRLGANPVSGAPGAAGAAGAPGAVGSQGQKGARNMQRHHRRKQWLSPHRRTDSAAASGRTGTRTRRPRPSSPAPRVGARPSS